MNEILLLAYWQYAEDNAYYIRPLGTFKSVESIERFVEDSFEVQGKKVMKNEYPVFYVKDLPTEESVDYQYVSGPSTGVVIVKEVVNYEGY